MLLLGLLLGGGKFRKTKGEEPMYGLEQFKEESHIFCLLSFFQKPMDGLDDHVWSRRRGGVTPHSEIIMGIEGLVLVILCGK